VKIAAPPIVLAALLAGAAATARADVQESDKEYLFFTPAAPWKLVVPKGDLKLVQEQRRPDGSGFYYMLTSAKQLLNFSVFMDRADGCSSGESCRALFLRNPGARIRNPKDVKLFEENGFHVAQFYVDGFSDIPMKQANLSAHLYRDGYWIDVRISLVARKPPDPEPLLAVLRSVTLR